MHTSYVHRSIIFAYVYTHLVITHIMNENLSNSTGVRKMSRVGSCSSQSSSVCKKQQLPSSRLPASAPSFPPACRASTGIHLRRHPGCRPARLPPALPAVDLRDCLPSRSPCSPPRRVVLCGQPSPASPAHPHRSFRGL